MITNEDKQFLQKKGIAIEQVMAQVEQFKSGFPFLKIECPAAVGTGIEQIQPLEQERYIELWNDYLKSNKRVVKFVPASGAASRMFKELFEFASSNYSEPSTPFEKRFFEKIKQFAFFPLLDDQCKKNTTKSIDELLESLDYKEIVNQLLQVTGLNYGALPKGLLKFHTYDDEIRTAFEEHLAEGIAYAKGLGDDIHLHFTVSLEHRQLFEKHLEEVFHTKDFVGGYNFEISFSVQKPSTDTVAVDESNNIVREEGKIVFRPGGHGALIENLNDIDADIVFIKNIDNVVPDRLKLDTIKYKQLIAGLLVAIQKQVFGYLQELEAPEISEAKMQIIAQFVKERLHVIHPHYSSLSSSQRKEFLARTLDRPIRVCGMVKNEGEPGGGPYMVHNSNGTISLQILESSQINMADPLMVEQMKQATYFNPVDLVCSKKNYKGESFNLLNHIDPQTGFISTKSKGSVSLKALELPGLWNGAMSDWNTLFVEVPISTFNPVKSVIDLLRPEHQ